MHTGLHQPRRQLPASAGAGWPTPVRVHGRAQHRRCRHQRLCLGLATLPCPNQQTDTLRCSSTIMSKAAAATSTCLPRRLQQPWSQLAVSQSMGACGGGSSSGGISSHPNSNSSSSSGSGRTLVVCNVIGGSGSRGGKVIYPCSNCGTVHRQYHGKCPRCNRFGTIAPEGVPAPAPEPPAGRAAGGGAGMKAAVELGGRGGRTVGWVSGGGGGGAGGGGTDPLSDMPLSLRQLSRRMRDGLGGCEGRFPLSGRTGAEVARVLGGGVVPGSLVLIGGDPGVGKSTLTLQVAAMVAHPEIDFDRLEDEGKEGEEGMDSHTEQQQQRHEEQHQGQQQLWGQEGQHWQQQEGPVVVAEVADGVGWQGTAGGGTGHGVGPGAGDWLAVSHAGGGVVGSAAGGDGTGLWGDERGVGAEGGGQGEGEEGEEEEEEAGVVEPARRVLYVTAEETREQVAGRGGRMGLAGCEGVMVLSVCEMNRIAGIIGELRPDAVVLDSINTVYLDNLPSAPGSVVQVRECGQTLLRLAKDLRIAVFIIGHVTKGGDIGGPNALAHMVDTVLYLEGDMSQAVRLLRVQKNRHGSADECGVFTMDHTGMHAVANHNALFLESRAAGGGEGASSVVGVTLQALVVPISDHGRAAATGALYRAATGCDRQRLATLCSVLDKHVPTLALAACSVIVNVVGGVQLREVAGDLALAVAVAASFFNTLVPRDLVVLGEVDLGGAVRCSFKRLDVRLVEAAKLGFRKAIIPRTAGWEKLLRDPRLGGQLQVVAVGSVWEALREALGEVVEHRPPEVDPPPRGRPPPGSGPLGYRFPRRTPASMAAAAAATSALSAAADGTLPRAAAMGGVAAAYAAAAAAGAAGAAWRAVPYEQEAGEDVGMEEDEGEGYAEHEEGEHGVDGEEGFYEGYGEGRAVEEEAEEGAGVGYGGRGEVVGDVRGVYGGGWGGGGRGVAEGAGAPLGMYGAQYGSTADGGGELAAGGMYAGSGFGQANAGQRLGVYGLGDDGYGVGREVQAGEAQVWGDRDGVAVGWGQGDGGLVGGQPTRSVGAAEVGGRGEGKVGTQEAGQVGEEAGEEDAPLLQRLRAKRGQRGGSP